ncbi:hypothetical protein MYX82_08015, partial [Acidobacteria bacterium AH-259-D05]|nr:hypothetical protein [Acidobacteria bacterium AH-259-D05]
MRKHQRSSVFCFLLALLTATLWGQQADIRSTLGYPDLIIHNAKIVTVDDASFESNVGTIVQAIAIRGDKILATGG